MPETHEEKIALLKLKLTFVNASLSNAANQIKAGKVVTAAIIDDLAEQQASLQKQIKNLESSPPEALSSPFAHSGDGSAPPCHSPQTDEGDEEEVGIPKRLRVKRRYTMTPAALEARKKNGQQPRPGSAGNKRNWKGGLFAKDFIEGRIKPCHSTCPNFEDCELVSDGYTKPGGVCLDKAAVITTYSAIMDAVKHKEHDDFNEVSGLMVAETMHVTRMLMEDIMRDGSTVKRERYDKEGNLQLIEYVSHPSLMALPKLIADLGLTPRELNITPKAIKDDVNEEERNKSVAGIMGDMARRMKERSGKREEDED